MIIPTLEYSANQPIAQQITIPTNSMYAVGVKVTKDGQVVDGNLSVDGVSASTKIGDYSIVKLSSDGFEGMKKIYVHVSADVETFTFPLQAMQKDMGYFELPDQEGGDEGGGDEGVSYSYSVEGYQAFINNEMQETWCWFNANELSASDGSTLPETLTLDARKITGSFVATGTDGYSLSGTLPQEVEEGMCFPMVVTDEGQYFILNNNGEYTWVSFIAGSEELTIVGPTITISTREEDYAEIDGCALYYPDGIPTKQINISVDANISFGT